MANDLDQDVEWAELAKKAQAGDAQSYRKLLTDIVPVIKRTVIRSLPSADLADDVVQEVLISVHKALHTYDPARPFAPWLMAIVSFRKTDFLRQHYAARGNKQVSIDSVDIPDYVNNKDDREDSYKDIEAALETLPEKQKKVVELLKLEGYSTKEVSQRTGLSESAVKVTMHRALQKLKEKLA